MRKITTPCRDKNYSAGTEMLCLLVPKRYVISEHAYTKKYLPLPGWCK